MWMLIAFLIIMCICLLLLQLKMALQFRVLTAFIAGIHKFLPRIPLIVKYDLENPDTINIHEELLQSVTSEFCEDFDYSLLQWFTKKQRKLFHNKLLANGGFNDLYLSFYDILFKESYYLKHRKNSGDNSIPLAVRGENLIYDNLMAGKFDGLKTISQVI